MAILAIAIVLTALSVDERSGQAAVSADVVTRGAATTRTVALTFDDGWHAGRCEEIHDTLVRFGVPATWFPNAIYVRASPALWRRIAERYPIGNHTTHHRSLPTLRVRRLRREIESNERQIESVTGRRMSKILRPPYGAYDRRVLREAGRLGYESIVLWDVSAGDTSRRATDRSVAKAALRGRAGSIVLMHCGPAVTRGSCPSSSPVTPVSVSTSRPWRVCSPAEPGWRPGCPARRLPFPDPPDTRGAGDRRRHHPRRPPVPIWPDANGAWSRLHQATPSSRWHPGTSSPSASERGWRAAPWAVTRMRSPCPRGRSGPSRSVVPSAAPRAVRAQALSRRPIPSVCSWRRSAIAWSMVRSSSSMAMAGNGCASAPPDPWGYPVIGRSRPWPTTPGSSRRPMRRRR